MGLLLLTRWTPLNPHTARLGSRKSPRRCKASSRRLATTLLVLPSFPSPDGTATTCWPLPPRCPGTRDGPLRGKRARLAEPHCSRLWTLSFHPQDLLTSLSDFPFRMSTRLEVLEQCQWAEWRLGSSSLVKLLPLLLTSSPLKSSLLRCITSLFQRLFPVTMLVSTSRTSPSRTSSVATSHPTQRTSPGHRLESPCKFAEIKEKVDRRTGKS